MSPCRNRSAPPHAHGCSHRAPTRSFAWTRHPERGPNLRAGGGQIGDSTDARHVFFYAPDGETPLGIELFGPRAQLETEGSITVVLPSGARVRVPDAEQLVREAPAAHAA
jgi:hypothetical protein